MKLALVIVSLVTALASCYTQAQQISIEPKPYRYVAETLDLLDEPEIQNSDYAADDYISLTEAKQVLSGREGYSYVDEARKILGEPETQNSAFANEAADYISLTEAQQVSNGQGGYSYMDEDQQIMDKRLAVADGPKNPINTEIDNMAMLLGRSKWCRSRDGQCRRGKFRCPDKYQESPYGRPYCTSKKRRCCYPGHLATCSKIWCESANEECDDNNGTTVGICQCADGYVRDKKKNCIGTCSVIWCDKANEECDDNAGTTAGSCQCADGYVRDKQNNCVVTPATSAPTTTTTLTTRSSSTTPISGCGGVFTSSHGTIRYPSSGGNYQNNEDCTWIIMAPVSFKIKFMSFDTESNYDYLYVRNGESMKGSFTGSDVPSPVAITTNNASLHFTSDGSQTRTGFEIQWEPTALCPEGFFRAGNSQQCFLFLMDIQRNWTDAKEKCEDEGYSLAEPQDPLAVKSYLVDTYEPEWSIWIGAQGDGSSLRWLRSGEVISDSDPLWYQNEPGTKVTPDHNIMLILSQFTNTPFISYPGRLTRNTLCELVRN